MRDFGQAEGRHLAAVLFMDMVGYSARMQENEARAIADVRALWDLVRPMLAQHGGREVDLAGDGMLMEFPGALAAVRCAQAVHARLHQLNQERREGDRVRVRVGVHLGDVVHRDGRIYGDGVNIAARVITLSPPGAIAMTAHVRDQLLNVLDEVPELLGFKQLKNIRAPLEIWCLPGPDTGSSELAVARSAAQAEAVLRRWSFGEAVFDERVFELVVGGQVVTLDKSVLGVLSHLLRHAGEVVTPEELIESAGPGKWPDGVTVEDCIAQLHAALNDPERRQIRVAEGFGYRFAAPVVVEALPALVSARFDFKPGDRPPLRPMWQLVERLGAGGHGEAWLARHDKTREPRVFKFANEPSALPSLKREITISRVLSDAPGQRANFVRILDWNLEEMPYFIESQYSDEGNLAQWIEKNGGFAALSLPARLELVAQVAEAVSAAHAVGVLHKDLKPSNVLVEAGGAGQAGPRIKLCDFGSGGVLDEQRLEAMGITRMGFTRAVIETSGSGSTSGTPLYLAPEVIAGQPFTAPSDVYALGVMLYQFVIGDLRKPLAPGWELNVPDELLREDIAVSAAGDPAHRLPDALLLAQRLRSLDQRRAQRAADRAAREKAEDDRRRLERARARRVWMVAAFAMLLAGTGVSLYLYRSAVQAREESDAVSGFLAGVLSMGNPHAGTTADLTLDKVLDRAAAAVGEELANQPGAEMRVRLAIAHSYMWMDRLDRQCEQAERAVALGETHFGRATPETMAALESLAECLLYEDPLKALPLHEEILSFWERQRGPRDPKALNARAILVNAHEIQGNYDQAIRIAEAMRYDDSRDRAADNDASIWLSSTLGMSLLAAGRYAEALRVFTEVKERTIRLRGADQFFMTWGQQWRGMALAAVGRHAEAEPELRAAVRRRSELMGEYVGNVLSARRELAMVWADQGRFGEAIAALTDMLEHGPADDRVWHLSYLADVHLRAGRLQQALDFQRQALAVPPPRPERRIFRAGLHVTLAEIQLELGQVGDARAALDAIPGETRERLGWLAPRVRRVEGLLLAGAGRRDEAKAVLRQALQAEEANRGPDHWRCRRLREELAALDRRA